MYAHTHTLSLALSLSLTHTHKHTQTNTDKCRLGPAQCEISLTQKKTTTIKAFLKTRQSTFYSYR
uniref:Secreted protein n=1 Tax=Anguilla anguilla TaxID=7936 RepID=A0A0E9XGU1_ANGAN